MVVRERKQSQRYMKQNNNHQPYRSLVVTHQSFSGLLSGEGCTKHRVPWINVVQGHLGNAQEHPWPYQMSAGYSLSYTKPNQG